MTELCTIFHCPSALTGAAHCVWAATALPHPLSPSPFFSSMGRLLSSWPAHGEKRGKGEGDGALDFLFAQDSLFRLVQHPTTFHSPHYPHTHLHHQQPTKCGDWVFCKNNAWMLHIFLLSLTPNKGCPLCVGSQTLPHPLPPFPFSHPWAGC